MEVWNSLLDALVQKADHEATSEFLDHLPNLLKLALHPIGTSRNPLPIELCYFMKPSGQLYGPPNPEMIKAASQQAVEPATKRRRRSEKKEEPPSSAHNVDGHMISGDIDLVGADVLLRSRIFAARAFARALARHPPLETSLRNTAEALNSPYSTTQMVAGMIIEEYARGFANPSGRAGRFGGDLLSILDTERPESYADILPFLRIVRGQCHALLNAFREHGHIPVSKIPSLAIVVQGEVGAGPTAFSIGNAESVVGKDFERLQKSLTPAVRLTSQHILDDARTATIQAIEEAKSVKAERDVRIRAAAASALVAIGEIPKKPSSLIKSIMDSIKLEENVELQKRSAASIASLLSFYATTQRRGPADKITTNLMSFYCIDTSETPEFRINSAKQDVILSLHKEEDRKDYANTADYEKEAKAARTTRRGTKEALDQLCQLFGEQLFDKRRS